jgi:hypothetical protein
LPFATSVAGFFQSVKSKGGDTIYRVEESISHKNKSAIEAIVDIFNPTERLKEQIADLKIGQAAL